MFQGVVSERIKEHYVEKGLINSGTKVNHALVAGNIYSGDEPKIEALFKEKGWKLFGPRKLKERLTALADKSWENDVVTLATKLLLRGKVTE